MVKFILTLNLDAVLMRTTKQRKKRRSIEREDWTN